MEKIFFESWESLIRTSVITILAYVTLIVMLRVSGKRTLAKMNAFDFIVTVALGSTLATVALNKSVPLTDGALAFFLLIFLQYVITWLSVRVKAVQTIVTGTPSLLLYKGKLLDEVMKKERITTEEIFAKARAEGFSTLDEIDAMVMETTGDITIMSAAKSAGTDTLENVRHFTEMEKKRGTVINGT